MIYGVGVDTNKISSTAEELRKSKNLKRNLFTEREIEFYDDNLRKLISRLAAKEAFAKAIGTGFSGMNHLEIEVLQDDHSRPYFEFNGRVLERMQRENLKAYVSLSYAGEDYAVALAVIEKVE
jgi:holo-[acyl-carrier protein] synthase